MTDRLIYARYLYSAKGLRAAMEVLPGGPFRNTREGHDLRIAENNREGGGRRWEWQEVLPTDIDFPEWMKEETT